MATVAELINQLQKNHDPDEQIIYQYVVQEHTDLDEIEFPEVAEYLMDNDNFADEASEMFTGWITEAQGVLADAEKNEE
jgi:hypothetical protein